MNAEEFIEDFLAHRSRYDPVKAREYYLRTRKLNPRVAQLEALNERLIEAKEQASKIADPKLRKKRLVRLAELQRRLEVARAKLPKTNGLGPSKKAVLKKKPLHTVPDRAGRPPGHPQYGDDPPRTSSSVGARAKTNK